MADDFQVKQSSSSSTAYGIGGAVVGGAAGGIGAHYLTKPKYGSYEEILAEAKDSTDFSSKIEKAEGEEKKFLEEAKALATKQAEAEKEYNTLLEQYKAAHADGEVQETEDFKKMVKDLEDKRVAAEKAEADKIRANNTGELDSKQKANKAKIETQISKVEERKTNYVSDRQKAIEEFNEKLKKPSVPYTYTEFGRTLTAEGNNVERLAQERKSFETMVQSIESHMKDKKFKKGSELTFIPDKGSDKGKVVKRVPQDLHELKLAKQYFEKQYQAKLDRLFEITLPDRADPTKKRQFVLPAEIQKQLMEESSNVIENIKVANENVATREQFLKDEITKLQKAEAVVNNKAEINKVVGNAARKAAPDSKIAKDFATYITRDFDKEIAKLDPKKDAKKIADLRRIQANLESSIMGHYNTIIQGDVATKTKTIEKNNLYKDILRRAELETKGAAGGPASGIGRAIGRWLGITNPGLDAKENQELQEIEQRLTDAKNRIGNKEFAKAETEAGKTSITKLTAENATLQTEIDNLNKTMADRATAQKEVRRIKTEISKITGDAGAKVNAAGEIILSDGKTKFEPKAPFKLEYEVSAPAVDEQVAKLEKTIANLKASLPNATKYTEEEILQMAKAQVEKDLEADVKAVEDARANLPKGAAKSAEELEKDFLSENKIESKAKFIEGKEKEAIDKFKDNFKKMFERKYGFAEHANWKIAGVAAAGALVLGGIACALAPKNNS